MTLNATARTPAVRRGPPSNYLCGLRDGRRHPVDYWGGGVRGWGRGGRDFLCGAIYVGAAG